MDLVLSTVGTKSSVIMADSDTGTHKPGTTDRITCGICRQRFSSSSSCCDHMKIHSRERSSSARPKSSVVIMTTSPRPHYSPPGSPLPKRPQTALATAFRKSPEPLMSDEDKVLKRSMSEPFNERASMLPNVFSHGDVVAWEPAPPPKPEKVFVCYFCQKEFPDALSLTRHSRIHGAAAPYSCSTCGKMFTLYSSLMTHEKSHAPQGSHTFRCRTCGSMFLNEASLKAHQRRHREAGGGPETHRPYQCMTCNEWMSNEVTLKIHMQRHEGFQAPRVCTLCGTTFSSDAILRAHSKVHEAEATTRCVICMRHFRRSRVLLRHSDVHADERHNVCDACDKRFPKVAPGSWRRMKWLTEEERQFQCLYCGVSFPRLHQLATHESCHTDLPLSAGKPLLHLPTVIVN